MRAKFLHMADCHLGYRQYNSRDRFNDFTRAFLDVVQAAIDQKVDFVVLAGDLFEKRAIDALTLNAATIGLEKLRSAGIPCLAIEGNHEIAYYRDTVGWMRFLAERELLHLLNPKIDGEEISLPSYERRQGAYIEPVPGLRVYGLRYYGSATAQMVQRVAAALEETDRPGVEYTIFMAHTGVEGVLASEAGGLSHRELAPLRPHVDYLALGHIHKPFSFDNWVFNPGSPETCTLTETAWPERGYYLVEVDTDNPDENGVKHRPALHANRRRPFERLHFKIDHCHSPDDLFEQCRGFVERKHRDRTRTQLHQPPVVELRLSGVLPFDRSGLDLSRLEELVQNVYEPLLCFVKNATQPADFAVAADQQLSRPALERQIVANLFERDARFRSRSQDWTELALAIKQLAITGAAPEAIVEELASGSQRLDASPEEEA